MAVRAMGNVQGPDFINFEESLPSAESRSPGVPDLKEDELKPTLVFLRVGHPGTLRERPEIKV